MTAESKMSWAVFEVTYIVRRCANGRTFYPPHLSDTLSMRVRLCPCSFAGSVTGLGICMCYCRLLCVTADCCEMGMAFLWLLPKPIQPYHNHERDTSHPTFGNHSICNSLTVFEHCSQAYNLVCTFFSRPTYPVN